MPIKPSIKVMQAAILIAEKQQTPFGVALAMGDEVFVTATQSVGELDKPRLHATAKAVQQLRERTQRKNLSGYTLYCTCDLCNNCLKTALDAGITTIIIGCTKKEMSKYIEISSYRETKHDVPATGKTDVQYGVMRDRCLRLLEKYS